MNAEGKVIDQNLGEIDLSGKTLTEAREILRGPLSELYNSEKIVIETRDRFQSQDILDTKLLRRHIEFERPLGWQQPQPAGPAEE